MTKLLIIFLSFILVPSTWAASLLTGCSPGNCAAPATWSIYYQQTFESATNPQFEFTNGNRSTTIAHGGTTSLQANISHDGDVLAWGLNAVPAKKIYVSWWEYVDSQARMNDYMGMWNISKYGDISHSISVDAYRNSFGTYNSTLVQPSIVVTGVRESVDRFTDFTYPVGSWVQWEVLFQANTGAKNDGLIEVYQNGTLRWTKSGANLNELYDMYGSRLTIGGPYQRRNWKTPANQCAATMGGTLDSNLDRCLDFNACTCGSLPPSFNRYIDDIIVMVSGGLVRPAPNVPTVSTIVIDADGANITWTDPNQGTALTDIQYKTNLDAGYLPAVTGVATGLTTARYNSLWSVDVIQVCFRVRQRDGASGASSDYSSPTCSVVNLELHVIDLEVKMESIRQAACAAGGISTSFEGLVRSSLGGCN